MADLTSTVNLVFAGRDQATKTINEVVGHLDRFNKGLTVLAAPALTATTALIGFEAVLARLALGLGSKAIDAFVTLERSIVELKKVAGDSPQVDAFARQVGDLAVQFGVSGAEALAAAADWVKAGFAAEENGDALELTRLALENSIASGADLGVVTNNLKTLMGQFGFTTEELRDKLNKLNTVADKNKVSSASLIEGIGGAAGAARLAGFSFEEYLAHLTAVDEANQSGSESARALRTLYARLTDPTKEATESLQLLGGAIDLQAFATGNAKERFELLIPALLQADEKTRAFILTQFSGADQSARLSALLFNQGTAVKALADQYGPLLTVSDEATRKTESLGGKFESLDSAITRTLASLGGAFETNLKDVLGSPGGKTGLIGIFTVLEEQIHGGALDGLFAQIKPQLEQIARIATEIAEAIPGAFEQADVSGFGEGLEILFGDLKGVKVTSGELANILTGVAEAFKTLAQFTNVIIDVFQGAGEALLPVIEYIDSLDEETRELIGQLVLVAAGVGGFGLVLTGIIGTVNTAIGAFSSVRLGIAGIAALVLPGAPVLVGLAALTAAIVYLREQTEIGRNIGDAINDWLVPDWLPSAGKDATLSGAILDLIDAIRGTNADIEKPVTAIDILRDKYGIFVDDVKLAGELLRKGFDDVAGGIDDMVNQAVPVLDDGTDAIVARMQQIRNEVVLSGDAFDEFGPKLDPTKRSIKELNAVMEDETKIAFKSYRNELGQIVTVYDDYNNAVQLVKDKTTATGVGFEQITSTIEENKLATQRLAGTYQLANGEIVKVWRDIGDQAFQSNKKTTQSIDESLKKTKEFQLKLLEIASNERIKVIEAKVDLDIANIEADTKRIEAAFGSLNEAIQSTGQTISSAFGALSAFAGLSEFDVGRNPAFEKILDQLKLENQFRKQAFDQQEKLNNAIIDNLRAKTKAFERGDPLIRIDGTGLEPELRAIMWYMLRAIQVEVNAEFADFLLGLNPSAPAGAAAA